jgi:hypothetical protein
MQKFVLSVVAFLLLVYPAWAGPVSDLVTQSQALHAEAMYLVADPQVVAKYPDFKARSDALIAEISATLPVANDGEYQGTIVGGLQRCTINCGDYVAGGGASGQLNLALQTGAYVLQSYQAQLLGDQAMLETLVKNLFTTPR